MTRFGWTATVVLAFALGCGAASMTQVLAVPPAQAASTQRWQQMCVPFGAAGVEESDVGDELVEPGGWNKALKRYGNEGWELAQVLQVGSYGTRIMAVCFKRPVPAAAAPLSSGGLAG